MRILSLYKYPNLAELEARVLPVHMPKTLSDFMNLGQMGASGVPLHSLVGARTRAADVSGEGEPVTASAQRGGTDQDPQPLRMALPLPHQLVGVVILSQDDNSY